MFFNKSNFGKRVALENSVLRERCQSIIEEASKATYITDKMKEDIHQVFFFTFNLLIVLL